MKFTVFDFDKRFPRGVLRMNDTLGSRQRFLKNQTVLIMRFLQFVSEIRPLFGKRPF